MKNNSIMKPILILFFLATINSLSCFNEPFPKIIGTATAETSLNVLDYSPETGDLVAAGYTADSSLKTS